MVSSVSTYKKFSHICSERKGTIVALFVGLTVAAFFEMASVAAIYTLFNSVFTAAGALPKSLQFVVDILHITDQGKLFVAACIFLIIAYFGKSGSGLFVDYMSNRLRYGIKTDMQIKLFDILINAPYESLIKVKSGEHIFKCLKSPWDVSSLLDTLPKAAFEIVRVAMIFVSLCFISAQSALSLFFIGGIFHFSTRKMMKRMSTKIGNAKVMEDRLQSELTTESFNNVRQVRAFNSMRHWSTRMRESLLRMYQMDVVDIFWLLMPSYVMEFLIILLVALFLIGAYFYFGSNFGTWLPILGVFGYCVQRLAPSFRQLTSYRNQFFMLLPSLDVVYAALTETPREDDGSKEFSKLQKSIRFENVKFGYRSDKAVLENLSFEIPRGETVALIGASGAGKSTILDLVLRLYRPSSGKIYFDSEPINNFTYESMVRSVGFVAQDCALFADTIRENVRMGREWITNEQITNAIKLSLAEEFVNALPEKMDTLIGERGVTLSGGQRQRLAIARAIVGNPDILVLDEATSALDSDSEKQIQATLNSLSKERTTLVVAHRLSTIRHANLIIVLGSGGEIIEKGTHSELLEKSGHYARLLTSTVH